MTTLYVTVLASLTSAVSTVARVFKNQKPALNLGSGQLWHDRLPQGETHRSTFETKPMTPRDRVPLSFISPNFSALFRIITNKKLRPVVEAA